MLKLKTWWCFMFFTLNKHIITLTEKLFLFFFLFLFTRSGCRGRCRLEVRVVCFSVVTDVSLPLSHRTWTQHLCGSFVINNDWIWSIRAPPSQQLLPLSFTFYTSWDPLEDPETEPRLHLHVSDGDAVRESCDRKQEVGGRGLWVSWWQDWTGTRKQNPPLWR